MQLDDPRWADLEGGYGIPFDPRPLFERLESTTEADAVWEELWENLHHEGEVGTASYAAVPWLVRIVEARGEADWNLYALAGTIELERGMDGNPELPPWLVESYEAAWERLFASALRDIVAAEDSVLLRCLLATLAIAKGDHRRGRMLLDLTDDELDAILGEEDEED